MGSEKDVLLRRANIKKCDWQISRSRYYCVTSLITVPFTCCLLNDVHSSSCSVSQSSIVFLNLSYYWRKKREAHICLMSGFGNVKEYHFLFRNALLCVSCLLRTFQSTPTTSPTISAVRFERRASVGASSWTTSSFLRRLPLWPQSSSLSSFSLHA